MIHAAGAIVWRPSPAGVEVVLVHRPRYDDWTLPKGKRAPGEPVPVTAVREVAEETGLRIELGRRLGAIFYRVDGGDKRVDFWAATPVDAGAPLAADDPHEVDGAAWLELAAAADRLSYPRDAGVLDIFATAPAPTTPLILLRHADALSRHAWQDAGGTTDGSRPLSAAGHAQAATLARILGCFPAARLVSSPAERCLATLRPYAAAAGAELEVDASFGPPAGLGAELADDPAHSRHAAGREGGGWPVPDDARTRLTELITDGRPAVICGHRENLPTLLALACERLGAPVPPGDPLAKGSFWILHRAGSHLAAAERHDTPATAAAPTH